MRHPAGILIMICLLARVPNPAHGQDPAWLLWNAGPAACQNCGQSGCNGLDCCQPGSFGRRHHPSWPSAARSRPNVRIGRGGFPDNELPRDPTSRCACGGAGCPLCRKTGPLRPGYLRAATLGWIEPTCCGAGCNQGGYPPGATAFPYPWDQQVPTQPWGGYQNFGNTCSGPYWYDFLIEGVAMTRSGQADQALGSDGIRGLGEPNIVLSSDSANFEYEPGFRVTGRFQWDAVNNLEVIYLGELDWDERAVVTSGNNGLFSVYSDFGNTPLGGFEETDQASEMSADTAAELESLELICRRSWVSPDYKVNGSWHIGARYIRFEDMLRFSTVVLPHFDPINMVDRDAASSQYQIDVQNDLVGPQIGTGLVVSCLPALAVGGEAKFGVYGNSAEQASVFSASTLQDSVFESESDTDVSFMSEARAYVLWQVHPMAKIRVGYEVWFLEDIATAPSNFNSVPPLAGTGTRPVFLNDSDQSLFHGGHVGLELGW